MPVATQPVAPVGKPIDRVDAKLKVTGQARYAAEAPFENCAHAVLVPSIIARGTIKSIDASAAEKQPGVLAILTPVNLPKLVPLHPVKPDFTNGGIPPESRVPLSDMTVHYYGQHIAVVVADTLDRARHAARQIKIDYAPQTPVISLDDPAAKTVIPEQSFGEPVQIHRGQDVSQIFNKLGDYTVIEHTYSTPPETHNPMEMHATTAAWDGDHLTIYDATQYVYGVRAIVADSLGIPRDNVRVLCPFVGGAFGCKGFQWPHTILAAAAAKVVKQPVKLMLTRQQMFTCTGHRSPTVQAIKLAATRDGKIVAAKHDTTMHCNDLGEFVEAAGMASTRVMYAIPNASITHTIKQTNVNIPTPMRAPGECPGTYALECALDELASELKIDPVELRLINHADVHPQTGKPWSSKYLKECYAIAVEKFGWKNRNAAPRSMRDNTGRLIGYGMATATYPGYRFPATARVRLMNDNGKIRAVAACAAHDLGTGAYTVLTQITAAAVDLPPEQVKFELGDTSLPYGPVAGGSNTTASVAQAITDAVAVLKTNLAKLAGSELASEENLDIKNRAHLRNKFFAPRDADRSARQSRSRVRRRDVRATRQRQSQRRRQSIRTTRGI
jgi:xanthine dehydrogenase YagR molybdenum-binding subunit